MTRKKFLLLLGAPPEPDSPETRPNSPIIKKMLCVCQHELEVSGNVALCPWCALVYSVSVTGRPMERIERAITTHWMRDRKRSKTHNPREWPG